VISAGDGIYTLQVNQGGKAEVWKNFSLVFKTSDNQENIKTNYCACNKCFTVYQLKDDQGKAFGTKNLHEHIGRCVGRAQKSTMQLQLKQYLRQQLQLSKEDLNILKQKEVEYCVDGYHSFRSVEQESFIKLLQSCVDLGAKYGKFDVKGAIHSRKVISRETKAVAAKFRRDLKERIKLPIEDGSISLCLDMYIDDYRKKSFLDVHMSWVERDFTLHHAALAVRHFGVAAHTAKNISAAVNEILMDYGLPVDNTPVTTDRGSNVVAALKDTIRLDCMCHRLHTVLECAWRETKAHDPDAEAYEIGISELCRYVKQATGIQEQLPQSLKHGGDTRPWVSMYRRAEALEASFEVLVKILTERNKLEMISKVSRSLNREIMQITKAIMDVFKSLEATNSATLQLVAPSYYLLVRKLKPSLRESNVVKTFREYLMRYLDEKYWNSITAFHWMATFLDPSFKQFEFLPQTTDDDIQTKRNILVDLDKWMLTEMADISDKLIVQPVSTDNQRYVTVRYYCTFYYANELERNIYQQYSIHVIYI
jgi:hypothetical protein